jgi:hypothetical protein
MVPFGMLRRGTRVRTGVSDDVSASIIRVRRICELGKLAASCLPDDGCAKFLRNVGSYESHTA